MQFLKFFVTEHYQPVISAMTGLDANGLMRLVVSLPLQPSSPSA
jgi:hypothetical protein